ncbi:DUF3466 family protein [Corallococcus sp. ZKHCc1 1396]|uniref:DUF3466 family protein n=1 Tax=Corallococcus soli TaxID=2710757 RepID=A0ABR9PJZ4_9BACT|nr:DUF3466 family protein [Corallococcus soli]MBE4748214.1 DUF3466 family protein [Corallococcus soli]
MHPRPLRLALLLATAILLTNCGSEEPDAPDEPVVECSGHGHLHGDHCHCDDGYAAEGLTCIPSEEPVVECGGHGHLHGDHCHCDEGYVEENGTCVISQAPVLDCGAHGHAHGDHCHCDAGYVEQGGTCVAEPPPVDPVLPRYTVVPIMYPGGTGSFALELNDSGQVIGNVRSAVIAGTPPPLIAYRWSGDSITELGILPGSNAFSRAYGINASGVVVGESDNDKPRAFRWENGAMTELGTLGGASSVATAINDSGVIVGSASNGTTSRAFRWSAGAMTDLGSIDGQANTLARAWSINGVGDVVGVSKNSQGITRATLWTRQGGIVNLGALDVSQASQAYAVNDAQQVVGSAVVGKTGGGSPIYNAFIWSDGTIRGLGTLGSLPAAIHSEAKALNASGWAVGYVGQYYGNASLGTAAAVLWVDEAIHDLNTLIPPGSGWTLLSAEGINTRGDIVGFGRLDGVTAAFKLVRQ